MKEVIGKRFYGNRHVDVHADFTAGARKDVIPKNGQRVRGIVFGQRRCICIDKTRAGDGAHVAAAAVHRGKVRDIQNRQRKKIDKRDIFRVTGRNIHGQAVGHDVARIVFGLKVNNFFGDRNISDLYAGRCRNGAGAAVVFNGRIV